MGASTTPSYKLICLPTICVLYPDRIAFIRSYGVGIARFHRCYGGCRGWYPDCASGGSEFRFLVGLAKSAGAAPAGAEVPAGRVLENFQNLSSNVAS